MGNYLRMVTKGRHAISDFMISKAHSLAEEKVEEPEENEISHQEVGEEIPDGNSQIC